jgi:signal transduction histidine kinase
MMIFFALRAIDRVAAPDPFLGYDKNVDAVTDIALIVVLVLLARYARRLARASLATLDEARFRAEEYERARHDYALLVDHRLANPLTVIKGAALTIQAKPEDPVLTEKLAGAIADAADVVANVSLSPQRQGVEEHELDAVPHVRT